MSAQIESYFEGIAYKRLSLVDTVIGSSQHEIGDKVGGFKKLLGTEIERKRKQGNVWSAKFFYFDDDQEILAVEDDAVSWYDTRRKKEHRDSEWRLYYPINSVTSEMREGDLFILARRPDGKLLFMAARDGSSIQRQLEWLFGISAGDILDAYMGDELRETKSDFLARSLLEAMEIKVEAKNTGFLDQMLSKFGGKFPTTDLFSKFARSTLPDVRAKDDIDQAVVDWFEREDELFQELEQHILGSRLEQGFVHEGNADVNEFLSFSLSVQNRRKSRAGHAFANHLATGFRQLGLQFEQEVKTENNKRIDFMIPGGGAYNDPALPTDRIFGLGAKTTCKDRWRQVLSEAKRLETKYLVTLETEISVAQLTEMADANLVLIVPRPRQWDFSQLAPRIHPTDLASFIKLAAKAGYVP